VSLPVILRHKAEVDIQEARDQLESIRVGLGNHVLARVREVLARIEKMPELHGKVWEDVRAATEAWRDDYNRVRPHGALGNRTPSEFARPVDGHAHLPALHG